MEKESVRRNLISIPEIYETPELVKDLERIRIENGRVRLVSTALLKEDGTYTKLDYIGDCTMGIEEYRSNMCRVKGQYAYPTWDTVIWREHIMGAVKNGLTISEALKELGCYDLVAYTPAEVYEKISLLAPGDYLVLDEEGRRQCLRNSLKIS